MPVVVEGYTPPHDQRLQHFKVTPDPGVIEVNMQPAANWDELVENTTTLYEEARQSRLGTEKFMLDGRHTGTGGGNHIVLGGADARRQPHAAPSRSAPQPASATGTITRRCRICFPALFIGPTSQAPRVDEARAREPVRVGDRLRADSRQSGDCPPWLVDRSFRHLLVDVTGNTHRAEFCIDKLYSPDRPTGRLGAGRVPRLRDAAARADEPGAAAVAAGA